MNDNPQFIDIEEIVKDKQAFKSLIYTPLAEAKLELNKRWEDSKLRAKVEQHLFGAVPRPFYTGFKAVLFRQILTPNYELRRFFSFANDLELEPFFLEYFGDKFTSNNPIKYSWGKMKFQDPIKMPQSCPESRMIIDFLKSDGKKISEVKTLWGQSLIEFHHELLTFDYPQAFKFLFDSTDWLHSFEGGAKEYYFRVLALFTCHGLLFENYLIEGKELPFVKEVFPGPLDVIYKVEATYIMQEDELKCYAVGLQERFLL